MLSASVYDQVLLPVIISHHTPTYLIGLIHETSLYFVGSFRLYTSFDSSMSPALSLPITVLHGDTIGVCRCPLLPCAYGFRCDSSTKFLSSSSSDMHE